ncbi:MAG: hypothetical protein RAP70_08395 [Candidatus Celaenobacter antarcticus]|nr:hypothetical protein [Candidatus Celaenobacter antarcticus]MDP8315076.1 hypothetical protein [Candidatus Celaenobacter antarcticus]
MKGRFTRSKVSPKSHKKIVSFIYAQDIQGDDIIKLERYLEERDDLHHIYIIMEQNPSQDIITVCNKYNHIKLLYSKNPAVEIEDIKRQFSGVEVKFEDRNFEDIKNRSLENH